MEEALILDKINMIINDIYNQMKKENKVIGEINNLTPKDLLNIILYDSIYALYFVTAVEDEFELEFNDDEIDPYFFSDLSVIVKKIKFNIK